MSALIIRADNAPLEPVLHSDDLDIIVRELAAAGIQFERWETAPGIRAGDSQEAVLAAYRKDIDRLVDQRGYQSVDVISLDSADPATAARVPELRQKFLSEHTHAEDEVRFFVGGRGLFSLHMQGRVYEVLCEQGDLIAVPAGTPHWFDMGPRPAFVAVRLFNNPDGWIANYTGESIAEKFSRLES